MRKQIDRNQPSIVKELRKLGCSVAITSILGKGFPDIVVGRAGKNYLLEIKDGDKPPSARELTPDEKEFHSNWQGQITVINNIEEAIKIIGL